MSSDRKPNKAISTRRVDGRYLRFSHRYNAWQIKTKDGQFRNVNAVMARAYAAAGFPIGVQT